MTAGILTLVGLGITVGLLFSSKKNRKAGRNFFKNSERIAQDLKGKFNELVDRASGKLREF